ncbi:MAG: hypothetical protein CMB99_11910 [Flavobacteriaceae bacterium]|nr:hypothetical protein [Flavobacteriaceae bacterium]|tara:strand:- start:174048 stop:175148 length:1101 start_codon:yes stop_codon:yes gene_type:complete
MIESVYFYVFVALTVIQSAYLIFFSSLLFKRKSKEEANNHMRPLSVIVYAKNNWQALSKTLADLFQQKRPKFEVIVVDNDSIDDTLEELEKLQSREPRLKVVDVKNNEAFWANKKYALTLGIKSASYEYIVFTQPNIHIQSENWLQSLSSHFSEEKTLIIGLSNPKPSNSLGSFFTQFENFVLSLFSLNFGKLGKSFFAWDSNFAFKKSEFFRVKGFIFHLRNKLSVSSLFLKDAQRKNNIAIAWEEDSFMTELPSDNPANWSTRNGEKLGVLHRSSFDVKFWFYLFYLTRLSFYGLGIYLLFTKDLLPTSIIFAVFIVLSMVVSFFILKPSKQLRLLFLYPFLDLFHLLSQIVFFIVYFVIKKKD